MTQASGLLAHLSHWSQGSPKPAPRWVRFAPGIGPPHSTESG